LHLKGEARTRGTAQIQPGTFPARETHRRTSGGEAVPKEVQTNKNSELARTERRGCARSQNKLRTII